MREKKRKSEKGVNPTFMCIQAYSLPLKEKIKRKKDKKKDKKRKRQKEKKRKRDKRRRGKEMKR